MIYEYGMTCHLLRCPRDDRSIIARPHVFFGATKLPEDRYDATSAEAVAELRRLLSG
jgi:hypothetical protein